MINSVDFDNIKKTIIGKGSYSIVYLTENKECYKVYEKSDYGYNKEIQMYNLIKKFDNNNLIANMLDYGQIEFFDELLNTNQTVLDNPDNQDNQEKINFIKYEYIGNDIIKFIDQSNINCKEFLKLYSHFLKDYLNTFCKNNITHFDIKCSNILYNQIENKFKLIDYNLSFLNEEFTRKNLGQYKDCYFVWGPEINYLSTVDLSLKTNSLNQIMNSYLDYINIVYQNKKNPFYIKLFNHIESQCQLYLTNFISNNSLPIQEFANIHFKPQFIDLWGIGLVGCECIYYIYNRDRLNFNSDTLNFNSDTLNFNSDRLNLNSDRLNLNSDRLNFNNDSADDCNEYMFIFDQICECFIQNFHNSSIERVSKFYEIIFYDNIDISSFFKEIELSRLENEFFNSLDQFELILDKYILQYLSNNFDKKVKNTNIKSIAYYKQTDIYKNFFFNNIPNEIYFHRLIFNSDFHFIYHFENYMLLLLEKIKSSNIHHYNFINYLSLIIS
jgi:tRNA A-37 threonylcarbamoyl transferase component Bud32